MRWLVRVFSKLIVGSICIGGMIVVTFDFLAHQDFGVTLIKFAILSVIVGVVVSLSNRIVDWSYRVPAKPRPAPQSDYKPVPVRVPLSSAKPIPQAPQPTTERRFARPPVVEVARPQKHAVQRVMDDRLGRFVENGERVIASNE